MADPWGLGKERITYPNGGPTSDEEIARIKRHPFGMTVGGLVLRIQSDAAELRRRGESEQEQRDRINKERRETRDGNQGR